MRCGGGWWVKSPKIAPCALHLCVLLWRITFIEKSEKKGPWIQFSVNTFLLLCFSLDFFPWDALVWLVWTNFLVFCLLFSFLAHMTPYASALFHFSRKISSRFVTAQRKDGVFFYCCVMLCYVMLHVWWWWWRWYLSLLCFNCVYFSTFLSFFLVCLCFSTCVVPRAPFFFSFSVVCTLIRFGDTRRNIMCMMIKWGNPFFKRIKK